MDETYDVIVLGTGLKVRNFASNFNVFDAATVGGVYRLTIEISLIVLIFNFV